VTPSRTPKRTKKTKSKTVASRRAKHTPARPQPALPRLPKNLSATVERVVEFQWTIAAYHPDLPAIFSTPAMVGLMELAAAKAIQDRLPAGTISVGTRVAVDHLKAVPQGTTVQASARLVENEGRFLVFEVQARANDSLIGRGKVYRAIVTLKGPDSIRRS
jgi:fluoroacetyl-CoA thioesterase